MEPKAGIRESGFRYIGFRYEVNGIDYIGAYSSLALGMLIQAEIDELLALPNPDGFARCTRCGETKPLSDFNKDAKGPDGVFTWCKPCHLAHYRTPQGRKTSRISRARRVSRKKGVPTSLTTAEWNFVLGYYDHRCAYCGKPETETGTLAQEHVYPISRGGGYTIHNIVPSCSSCNSRKSARTPEEAGLTLRRIPLTQTSMFDE